MKKYFLIILVMILSVNIAKSQTHYENQESCDKQNTKLDFIINGAVNLSASGCSSYVYQLSPTTNIPVTWQVSPNLEIISCFCSDNNTICVAAVGEGSGFVEAYIGDQQIANRPITVTSGFDTYFVNETVYGSMTINEEGSIIAGTFTISNGAIVTINTTVLCYPEAKIVIQPGGKLIVDGGTITNQCSTRQWDGIYVKGNSNQRQLAQYQGTLEVKNNSLIENAQHIYVWDGNDENTAGGIVKCSNSTFHNCGRIEFKPYVNHNNNNVECDNVSYFTSCTFTVDNSHPRLAHIPQNDHIANCFIYMNGINGIKIKGCTFNKSLTGQYQSIVYSGIVSDGSGYTVTEKCTLTDGNTCTCVLGLRKTEFNNLTWGVYALGNGNNRIININKSKFNNCVTASFFAAINNFKFTENNVTINDAEGGLTLQYSTGYTIEGNNFHSGNQTTNTVGVSVGRSGDDENKIYRNTFQNLATGIYSWMDNFGLQFLCNNFSGSSVRDIDARLGISLMQGSSSKSAGNKFSQNTFNIYAQGCGYPTYYLSGSLASSNQYYPATVSNTITRQGNITPHDCASTLCAPLPPIIGPIIIKSATNTDISQYDALQEIFESRLAEYNANGYGFLINNFDETAGNIVKNAMRMQDTLVSIRRAMAEIANRNINAILQDTLGLDRNLLNAWYNRINTLTAKYSLVNSYFETGEYDLARQELASIPQRFALDEKKLAEYDNFCQYNALRESVFKSNRNYYQLTEEEIAELNIIAERNTGVSSAYANSVLCFFYGICRDMEPEIDSDMDNTPNAPADLEEEANDESFAIYVYPNPADEELNILFNNLPDGKNTIEFHDITGRLMFTQEITSTNTSINISSLKQGVYMYRIVNDGNVIARDRVVKE